MNKDSAREYVNAHRITFGELRQMLDRSQIAPDQISQVNASMTHRQAIDILRAGIKFRTDQEVVSMFKTRDILVAINIVRECL